MGLHPGLFLGNPYGIGTDSIYPELNRYKQGRYIIEKWGSWIKNDVAKACWKFKYAISQLKQTAMEVLNEF